jgi:hypothetical protein
MTNRCAHCRQPLDEAAQGRCGDPELPPEKCWWIYAIPEMGMEGAIEMGQKIADRILPPGMVPKARAGDDRLPPVIEFRKSADEIVRAAFECDDCGVMPAAHLAANERV